MTGKEREKLANEIIKEEKIIQNKNSSKQMIQEAQDRLSNLILSCNLTLEDMGVIDDIVQKNFS